MSEWQPIESAPKDGTWVLTLSMPATVPSVLRYDEGEGAWVDDFFSTGRAVEMPFGRVQLGDPTHWQPCPEPPQEQSA